MPLRSRAFARQKLCVDYSSLKHACPKGVYVAPVPEEPLLWNGVLFVRKGPYANAILRFEIDFPADFPLHPPLVVVTSEVFHPLVTASTTYSYSARDTGHDVVSASDEERLPPGGVSLRHGFPEWFGRRNQSHKGTAAAEEHQDANAILQSDVAGRDDTEIYTTQPQHPHVIEVLQYLRVIFDTAAVLDSVPLEAAANESAWHAWKSHRAKRLSTGTSPVRRTLEERPQRTSSLRQQQQQQQQPGGARTPAEWNWKGVWEDRVKRSIQASVSEQALFGGGDNDVIGFLKMDQEDIDNIKAASQQDEYNY